MLYILCAISKWLEIADKLVHRIKFRFHMKSRIMYVANYDIITDFWKRPKEGHKHCNIQYIIKYISSTSFQDIL